MGGMDRALVDAALDRAPVHDDGRSGAVLERVLLADGSRVVVEHPNPAVRERERVALPWWLRQAELALGSGYV